MSANPQVPDAWDDDWEPRADALANDPTPPTEKKVSSKVTKAQRRAQQAEFNRQLWAEAYVLFAEDEIIGNPNSDSISYSETPQTFHFVEARPDVPLKQDIKPAVTLLSRRPQLATRQSRNSGIDGATTGLRHLGLDAADDDSEDEADKAPEPTFEERQAIALKNREEKQRKYEEARERLFGSPSANNSGASSPGSTTPPRQQFGEGRGKGKGRGGNSHQKRDSSAASSKSKHLYDPTTSARSSGSHLQRRDRPGDRSDSEKPSSPASPASPAPQQPTRHPRGPDASGRGGFKFNRGARGS
ncbi:hypothetical protein N7466_004478 [Penicillium verhagenii]|uniref:uncharacterized protein n=1 Tax=Penicillium verhagenii TaxID=1562060 RepID=UPI0025452C32|nr:uncharacterized protein N7466_004478 [Penicillium verhagenii]KAJ5934931.1 hypothetical protein N7466_004478 [Penicillium verhagenii]